MPKQTNMKGGCKPCTLPAAVSAQSSPHPHFPQGFSSQFPPSRLSRSPFPGNPASHSYSCPSISSIFFPAVFRYTTETISNITASRIIAIPVTVIVIPLILLPSRHFLQPSAIHKFPYHDIQHIHLRIRLFSRIHFLRFFIISIHPCIIPVHVSFICCLSASK